jgi:hypothetical protein
MGTFDKKHSLLPFYIGSDMHFGRPRVMHYSKFIPKSLKNRLDLLVISSFESGFFDYWREKRIDKNDIKFSFHENTSQSLSLHNLRGIYIIFFCGICISGLSFMLEFFYEQKGFSAKLIYRF